MVIGRAPWEIIPDKLIVYRSDFLLRRGARTLRVFYWPAGRENFAEKSPAPVPRTYSKYRIRIREMAGVSIRKPS